MKNLYLITMTVISITISFNSYSQWVSLTECEFYGQASDIAETADGGIVACGWLSSEPSFYVTKINASGVNEWETIIDHPDFHDYAYNILSDDDGGFIIAGQDTYFATPFLQNWTQVVIYYGHLLHGLTLFHHPSFQIKVYC